MEREPLDFHELAKLPSHFVFTLSWDGNKAAYYSNETGRIELYVMDLDTKQTAQLTSGQAPSAITAGFVWTRDDRYIVFAKDNKGDEHHNLYRINVETKEVEQLNDDPDSQEYILQSHPDRVHYTVESTRSGQLNVHLLHPDTKEWAQLTDFTRPSSASVWSPDGEWLAVMTNESDDLRNEDGYLVNKAGEHKKVLSVSSSSADYIHDWHPSGASLLVSSDSSGVRQAGILNLATGHVRWYSEPGIEEEGGTYSKNGHWFSAVRNHDASLKPMLYNVETGEARTLVLPSGLTRVIGFVHDDSKLVVRQQTTSRRPEVLLYDLATDQYEVLLAAEYGSISPEQLVQALYVKYPSTDGTMVPAILYVPQGIEDGERVPAIIDVHGGPTDQWYRSFYATGQLLASRGYAVLMPNPRGSAGYGVEWRDACLKDWGGKDLEDVAAGANYLASLGFINADQIAIMGGSYGGYMTYMAVTKKPELFRAAVAIVGITDLHLLYEENPPHFKYYLQQQMGHPEQDATLWRDRSAVTHAENLKAKLMMMHGLNDPRCPISQAHTFREKLLACGKTEGTGINHDFEYHEFDIGHGGGGAVDQMIKDFELITDFFARRLGNAQETEAAL